MSILDIKKNELVDILNETDKDGLCYEDSLKSRVLSNKLLEPAINALNARAVELESIPDEPLTFSSFRRFVEDGNRNEYERKYFLRRKKLLVYGLKSWLYGKDEDLKLLMDEIWTVLDEYSWSVPAHLRDEALDTVQSDRHMVDLFAAETAQALSEIIALVGDRIHPIIKERIDYEIERRIYSQLSRDDFFWKRTTINWSAVCSGSVGMSAIYRIEDNNKLADILLLTFSCLKNFLNGFSKDGVCLEGISYWHYGFGYFINFAELLKRRTKGKIDLFKLPEARRISLFYPSVFFEGGRTVSFSDANSYGKLLPGYVSMLADEYEDFKVPPKELIDFEYYSDGCARFATSLRQFLYTASDISERSPEVSGTYLYPDAQWYISTSRNGVSIAAKGGNNAEPHNHNDVGSFQVFKNGEELLSDIGGGEYTRQYFSDERYMIFCNSSWSHSVPVINGQYQKAGKEYSAKDFTIDDGGISLDISQAYDIESLESLKRSISFNTDNGEIKLGDEFSFTEAPVSVVECFVSAFEPVIYEDHVLIAAEHEKAKIMYDRQSFAPTVEKIIDSGHGGYPRTTYLIKLEAIKKERQIFAEFIIYCDI